MFFIFSMQQEAKGKGKKEGVDLVHHPYQL